MLPTRTTGLIRVLIRDEGEFAANGTFKNPLGSSLGEYSSISVGGVTYYITYHYNAATEQFDTGNDVALVSTYFSVPQMKFHDPGADATRVVTALVVGTQYQLSDNVSQQGWTQGSTWASGNPTFSYGLEKRLASRVRQHDHFRPGDVLRNRRHVYDFGHGDGNWLCRPDP